MNTPFSEHITLKGSKKPAPDGTAVDGIQKSTPVNITLRLRSAQPLPDLLDPEIRSHFKPLSREDFAAQYGTTEEDIAVVRAFALHAGLNVIQVEPRKRAVELQGTVTQLETAFKVTLSNYTDPQGRTFRGRTGDILIPKELEEIVEGVFGLDTRPVAAPKIKRRLLPGAGTGVQSGTGSSGTGAGVQSGPGTGIQARAAVKDTSYYPTDIARLYNFPEGATGKNQCIAIIELGGGYTTSDINTYYQNLGFSAPDLISIPVDGGSNDPGTTVSDSDGEVTLDIEVAGTIAPDARIAVYFAGNTTKSFQDAVNAAIHDTTNKPSIISISWGGPEDTSETSYYTTFDQDFQSAATLGITVCAAAGDSGSSDGVNDGNPHVDYPASSPYVLGCGGTTLQANVQTDTISSEVVWNEPDNGGATGGGVSDIFALPSYQANAKVPLSPNTGKAGRGVPDVAGDADPATGYNILLGGQSEPIGGTSAVAPLMAGLLARINEQLGKSAGFIHPRLYANPSVCRDITQGNNDTVSGTSQYVAGPGWDACTGNGVPDGTKLLGILQG
jgi:kumamolisin